MFGTNLLITSTIEQIRGYNNLISTNAAQNRNPLPKLYESNTNTISIYLNCKDPSLHTSDTINSSTSKIKISMETPSIKSSDNLKKILAQDSLIIHLQEKNRNAISIT